MLVVPLYIATLFVSTFSAIVSRAVPKHIPP